MRERLAGEVVELIEELEDLFLRLLVQVELKLVIVGEPQFLCGLVAELDQCLQVGLDERTDPFAPFPDGLALGRVA